MHRLVATTPIELDRTTPRTRSVMGALRLASLFLSCAVSASQPAFAVTGLQISPVLIEIPAGGSVATVNIGNQDSHPVSIQVRLFRWSQADGEETLTPTDDVVASPPIAVVEPRATLDVRVIRVAKTDIAAEESYRLVVDQLPQEDERGRSTVSFLLREVLPVFFEPAGGGSPEIAWSLHRTRSGYLLQARNSGDRRLRIQKVLLSGGAATATVGGGLLGYSLAHSEISWNFSPRRVSFPAGSHVTLRCDSDAGTLHAVVPVSAGE